MKTQLQRLAKILNASELEMMDKFAIMAAIGFAADCIEGKNGEQIKKSALEQIGTSIGKKVVEVNKDNLKA